VKLESAIRVAGSGAALARALGVSPSTIYRWKKRGIPKRSQGARLLADWEKSTTKVQTPLLDRALKKRSAVQLAKEAGVSVSTVRRWRREGVPRKRLDLLEKWESSRKKEARGAREDLKRLKELRELAENTYEFAPVKTRTEKIDGRIAIGIRYEKAWKRELKAPMIEQVRKWVVKHVQKFSHWLLRARLAQFSREEDFGMPRSGDSIEVYLDDPDRNYFQAEVLVPSPRFEEAVQAAQYMMKELDGMLRKEATIFLLSTELDNYRFRTPEEKRKRQKAWREKWAKKRKNQND
jgi:transcriptional regulator with XRE-family HTH domain